MKVRNQSENWGSSMRMGNPGGDGETIGRIRVQGGVGGPGLGMRVVAKIPPPHGETLSLLQRSQLQTGLLHRA